MELFFFGGGIPLECEEIERTFPSSFRLVPHNVSEILATLWLTMWTECEKFVRLNEDPYCQMAQPFAFKINLTEKLRI